MTAYLRLLYLGGEVALEYLELHRAVLEVRHIGETLLGVSNCCCCGLIIFCRCLSA